MENIVSDKNQIQRIRLHVDGLDENLQGGIPKGHVTLISGPAGTMKSSLCFNTLYNEATKGMNSLYVSLEQSAQSLVNHMINMEYDMSKVHLVIISELAQLKEKTQEIRDEEKGSIVLVDLGAIRKEIREVRADNNKSWLNVIKNVSKKVNQEAKCELFVLDSLSALYVLSRFDNPRIELFYIFEYMRDMNVTSYLISEMPLDGTKFSQYEVEDFLADGIITIRLTPFRRQVVREIRIVKMRATACNNDIFSLEYKNGRFQALYGGQNPLL